jgi:hypothetical protein
MRYAAGTLFALTIAAMLLVQQPAHSEKVSGVVVLVYPPFDCKTDFDYDFWAKYDSAMIKEWNIQSQTLCLDGLTEEDKANLQVALQRVGLNVIIMQDDNQIVDGINDRAHGVAQPSVNFGAVEFNYERSTTVLSHETLHLMLEEAGNPKTCYVEAVHDNAYSYARYYDDIMILAHFEC